MYLVSFLYHSSLVVLFLACHSFISFHDFSFLVYVLLVAYKFNLTRLHDQYPLTV